MNSTYSFVSLLPPLLVLVVGYLTHRVVLSLGCGIILSAFISHDFNFFLSLNAIISKIYNNIIDPSNLHIFIFLIFLGIIIVMLQFSGGAYAYTQFAKRRITSKKGAESSSLILSTGLFLDDYLSSLTVGSVMHPLTDAKKIPKVKLAFLVDSMSIPFAILCPFSGWVAAVLGFLGENGISPEITNNTLILAKPFETYIRIMPYIFYSFVVVASTWFIVRRKVSFGLMKKHEDIAKKTGDLYGGMRHKKIRESKMEHNPHHTTLLEFFLPIAIMLISFVLCVSYSGSAATGLMLGGFITVALCLVFFIIRGRIAISQFSRVFSEGTKLMFPCVIVLLFAWTLGDFLRNELYTGEYLAQHMLNAISVSALPMIIFFTACLIATTIGSAWGTAAMLFPIVIPLVLSMTNAPELPTLSQIPMLFPVLGATLSGCIAGNHISPIADTTIMSTISTNANLKDHVYTQMQYALPGILVTGASFWLSGILIEYGVTIATVIPIVTAVLVNFVILEILQAKACQS